MARGARSSAESLLRALPVTKREMPSSSGEWSTADIDLRLSDRDIDSKMLRDLLKELTPPSPDEVSKAHWRNDEEAVGKGRCDRGA